MKYSELYPVPSVPKDQMPPHEGLMPETVLDKKASVHWPYSFERAAPLEDLAWKNLLLRAKPLHQLKTVMGQLAAVRTRIMTVCAEMDVFSDTVQKDIERMLMDALEVGEEIVHEAGIDEDDGKGTLGQLARMQQGADRQRAKNIFEDARRRFDPTRALPTGFSIYSKAREIVRRVNEEGKFVFTEEHRTYTQLSGQLHGLLTQFNLLVKNVQSQLPKAGHGKGKRSR